MGKIRSTSALVLIVIIAVSSLTLLMVTPVSAQSQSTPIPSVPEFSIKLEGDILGLPVVTITITNQPFTPYTDQHGNKIGLYYVIQWKEENSSDSWHVSYEPLKESNSNYTVTNLGLIRSEEPPPTGQVDFQIDAFIGYITSDASLGIHTYIGNFSGWSNTQTITSPINTSTSSTPTYAPMSLTIYAILVCVAVLLAVLVLVLKRKTAYLNR